MGEYLRQHLEDDFCLTDWHFTGIKYSGRLPQRNRSDWFILGRADTVQGIYLWL